MKKTIAILFLIILSSQTFGQSQAHSLSNYAIIDPAYRSNIQFPQSEVINGTPWIYGYAELESWRLSVLRAAVKEAELKVGYPGVYHSPFRASSFQMVTDKGGLVKNLQFYAVGKVSVFAEGKLIYKADAKSETHSIILPNKMLIKELRFDLLTNGEPACLLIKDGPFSTTNREWYWKADKALWEPAYAYSQNLDGIPPHNSNGLGEVKLTPVLLKKDLYDFKRELLGYIYIKAAVKPGIYVGESVAEATDTANKVLEQTLALVPAGKDQWRSQVPLAFRYVKVSSESPFKITCNALFHPATYKGAFASSDSLLTKIWMNSAYTLRLCMHDFLIDGVKRDRLPWAGDLAMSMQANAYSFADKELVRKSLLVLGRAGIKQQNINGIIDYSLWWIISQNLYQLYFADSEHLKREWPRIKEALTVLNEKCDALGFIDPKDTWLFIDWVEVNKKTTLQMLWWWAQKSAAELAARMGDQQMANIWLEKSRVLKSQLTKNAWNSAKGAWMDDPYQPKVISRHANIMAVVSGLADTTSHLQIANVLQDNSIAKVGTPYMAGFEYMALSRLGASEPFINGVKDYWGTMIRYGATTFWEAYDPAQTGDEMYSFYGRPYAKSLCHAWSAGPAAFLPSEILGVRPLEDGWKRFSVDPKPGYLQWITSTVPTPQGDILISIKDQVMTLQVPGGTVADWKGKLIYGPKKIVANIN
ncbi:alpha-L-rhamnosidase C-terminal domain-containing protein [Pedobacter frigoris]|uniref:alpha-L-rhamnosidase-related protein n=1 Tax=Pedobacter frigoris TaxID=2571272 RepID=UPI0029306A3D|nr:alpha-L-rhamnosidase C-terminal domain-containing protein [Pedobacter frigoris]